MTKCYIEVSTKEKEYLELLNFSFYEIINQMNGLQNGEGDPVLCSIIDREGLKGVLLAMAGNYVLNSKLDI